MNKNLKKVIAPVAAAAVVLAVPTGVYAEDGAQEKITFCLDWTPNTNHTGLYVAQAKGYYDEVGLNVTIIPGGGDISETTAVYNGTVDFGVTWVSNLINADAGGMDLLEVAQVYQRSGLVLVYKNDTFKK